MCQLQSQNCTPVELVPKAVKKIAGCRTTTAFPWKNLLLLFQVIIHGDSTTGAHPFHMLEIRVLCAAVSALGPWMTPGSIFCEGQKGWSKANCSSVLCYHPWLQVGTTGVSLLLTLVWLCLQYLGIGVLAVT